MNDALDQYRDEDPSEDVVEPELYYESVDEFVREKLRYSYARVVSGRGQYRWSARWWESAEAVSRLEALWRAWEHLRLEPALGMSSWWRDHADHHMAMLLSPEGPFNGRDDENAPGEPLPYEAPPPGLFPSMRG